MADNLPSAAMGLSLARAADRKRDAEDAALHARIAELEVALARLLSPTGNSMMEIMANNDAAIANARRLLK